MRWQTQQDDEALRDFEAGISNQPEWGNSNWVKVLYSPLVAQSLQEMQTETQRRKQKMGVLANR